MEETHILGEGVLKPEITYKLISATLELERIRDNTLKNFTKGRREIESVIDALIFVANGAGVSIQTYRETANKIRAMRKIKTVANAQPEESGRP